MRLSQKINPIVKLFFKIIIMFLIVCILIAVSWMSSELVENMVNREKEQLQTFVKIYRHYILSNDSTFSKNSENALFFLEVVTPIVYFPVIITDENNEPIQDYLWYTLNLDETLNSIPTMELQRKFLISQINLMKESYPPIKIPDNDGNTIAIFYYCHSPFVDMLKYFPLLSVLVVVTVMVLGYFAFNMAINNEQSLIWVGMAKETAHQLGTPISSLLAWLEILKINKNTPDIILETANEINNDVERLSIIATRFSKIGSAPDMSPVNISQKIDNVFDYYEHRLPHLEGKVTVVKNYPANIFINANEMLIGWVFENLIKNAVEALEGKKGQLTVTINIITKKIQILIIDTGKGMNKKMKYQIFEPGFTTKKRGWGIGLSLVKRIIENYHNGKVYVKESAIGKGTTFAIELPFSRNTVYNI